MSIKIGLQIFLKNAHAYELMRLIAYICMLRTQYIFLNHKKFHR